MVARFGSRRDRRSDRDRAGRARPQRQRPRSEAEPTRRRAANVVLAHDLGTSSQIEREAGTTDVENDPIRTGVRHAYYRPTRPRELEMRRRSAPLAPAEADASASRNGTAATRATPTIIAR